jgi:hypothetical protein
MMEQHVITCDVCKQEINSGIRIHEKRERRKTSFSRIELFLNPRMFKDCDIDICQDCLDEIGKKVSACKT